MQAPLRKAMTPQESCQSILKVVAEVTFHSLKIIGMVAMPMKHACRVAQLRVIVQCLGSTHVGDFHLPGAQLRKQGWNRIGNMLVPNSNYCKFEDWVMPILDQLLEEQQQKGTCWTPSKVRLAEACFHLCPRYGQHH